MNRRTFTRLGLGLLASSLPVAIAACRPGSGSDAETTADGFVAVGTVADLDAQGSLTSDLRGRNLAIVRDPANPEVLIAVRARCTHSGCTVDWQPDRGEFACPCHGGRFQPDGTVTAGPPPRPLETFAAKIEGDQVLVKV
jgi:cytochrome b6-f complex iron-sulfur subunit